MELFSSKPLPRVELGTSALPRQRSNRLSYRGMKRESDCTYKKLSLLICEGCLIRAWEPFGVCYVSGYLCCM